MYQCTGTSTGTRTGTDTGESLQPGGHSITAGSVDLSIYSYKISYTGRVRYSVLILLVIVECNNAIVNENNGILSRRNFRSTAIG
jgi:hypothetical protein